MSDGVVSVGADDRPAVVAGIGAESVPMAVQESGAQLLVCLKPFMGHGANGFELIFLGKMHITCPHKNMGPEFSAQRIKNSRMPFI